MTTAAQFFRTEGGRYLSTTERWWYLESGEWTPLRWEEATGKEWFETEDGDLVELTPVPESDLPSGTDVEETPYGVVVR